MSTTPYMLIEQAGTPYISRKLRQPFGRLAFVTDQGTVELSVNAHGAWSVQVGPAPQQGGEFVLVARGSVKEPIVTHARFDTNSHELVDGFGAPSGHTGAAGLGQQS